MAKPDGAEVLEILELAEWRHRRMAERLGYALSRLKTDQMLARQVEEELKLGNDIPLRLLNHDIGCAVSKAWVDTPREPGA